MKGNRIVVVAHDSKKKSLAEWATYNKGSLKKLEIWALKETGTC
jgi:methylglyoxal synthase